MLSEQGLQTGEEVYPIEQSPVYPQDEARGSPVFFFCIHEIEREDEEG